MCRRLAVLAWKAASVVFALPLITACAALPPAATVQMAPTRTMQMRSDLAPPATRPGLSVNTPEFAANVPTPRTRNFDPVQLELGRRIYTQWCATCHGDQGQGLARWRSTWPPSHQNCSQAGCHGKAHPPDGFAMLTVAPPLIGKESLSRFPTAFSLYIFSRATMPYQAPGSLSEAEYWAVTAFLADQHGGDPKGAILSETNAQTIMLH